MKPNEIREKSVEEIKNDLAAAEENLKTLGFQKVTAQLDNTSLLRKAKRDIARLKTILRERELENLAQAQPAEAPSMEVK